MSIGHQGCDVALDPEPAVEKRPLSGNLAPVDSERGGPVGGEAYIGIDGDSPSHRDRAVLETNLPRDGWLSVDRLLYDEADTGSDLRSRRRPLEGVEPVVGKELGHMGRLEPGAIASAA